MKDISITSFPPNGSLALGRTQFASLSRRPEPARTSSLSRSTPTDIQGSHPVLLWRGRAHPTALDKSESLGLRSSRFAPAQRGISSSLCLSVLCRGSKASSKQLRPSYPYRFEPNVLGLNGHGGDPYPENWQLRLPRRAAMAGLRVRHRTPMILRNAYDAQMRVNGNGLLLPT